MKNIEAVNVCHDKIKALKVKLQSTDYLAIKFFEGAITMEEYAPIREQRRQWRLEIGLLEAKLEEIKNGG